ncbi:MAG: hypothetical protein ACYC96_11995 [Fimbriimonadaceae bacterium]
MTRCWLGLCAFLSLAAMAGAGRESAANRFDYADEGEVILFSRFLEHRGLHPKLEFAGPAPHETLFATPGTIIRALRRDQQITLPPSDGRSSGDWSKIYADFRAAFGIDLCRRSRGRVVKPFAVVSVKVLPNDSLESLLARFAKGSLIRSALSLCSPYTAATQSGHITSFSYYVRPWADESFKLCEAVEGHLTFTYRRPTGSVDRIGVATFHASAGESQCSYHEYPRGERDPEEPFFTLGV